MRVKPKRSARIWTTKKIEKRGNNPRRISRNSMGARMDFLGLDKQLQKKM